MQVFRHIHSFIHPVIQQMVRENLLCGKYLSQALEIQQQFLLQVVTYKQQVLTVQPQELCSMCCGSLDGRGVWWRIDTCICKAESFCRSSEMITTLLIGYSQIQNKKLKKKEQKYQIKHKMFYSKTEVVRLMQRNGAIKGERESWEGYHKQSSYK